MGLNTSSSGLADGRYLSGLLQLFGLSDEAVALTTCSRKADSLPFTTPVVVRLEESDQNLPGQLEAVLREIPKQHVFIFGPGRCTQPQVPGIGGDMNIAFAVDTCWGPLSGLTSHWPTSKDVVPTRTDLPSEWQPLLSVGDTVWLYRRTDVERTAFFWAASQLPDVDRDVTREEEELGHCLLPLLPILAFLRYAFADRIWHAPRPLANFIIDDPPVRERYGYFSPQALMAALEGEPQTTTVAFIPWNWNRTTRAAVDFFRSHSARLSLCVHGCDHTGGEFASADHRLLEQKSALAQERMRRLEDCTGLAWAPIMVFPQGRFSTTALSALRRTGFLAAVNSTLVAEGDTTGSVSLRDLVAPARCGRDDFPLFLRRYPTDPVVAAIDLYLGRPLLVVEHHGYFQDGYAACRHFFAAVNSFRVAPLWVPLRDAVTQAYLQRHAEDGAIEVRFFTDICRVVNKGTERTICRLFRECRDPHTVQTVTVNNRIVSSQTTAGQLQCEIVIEPQATVLVQLHRRREAPVDPFRGSYRYSAGVWLRRTLCDLRDNYPVLGRASRGLKVSVERLKRSTSTVQRFAPNVSFRRDRLP